MQFRSLCALLLSAAALYAQQPPASGSKDLAILSGRTVDPDGKPLRKTALTLRPSATKPGETSVPYGTASDAEGKFSFDGVEPGKYILLADHAGYLRQAYGTKKHGMTGTILTLTTGQRMTELTFSLVPQSVISGKVVDSDGDPVSRAQVRMMRNMYMNGKRQLLPTGFASSDESGEFKITNIAAGHYFLSAVPQRNGMFESTRKAGDPSGPAKPEEDFVTTYYPGVTDGSSATAIEVVTGQNLAGMDIRLRKTPMFRIKGKLSGDASGEPLQRLRITVMQRDALFMGFGGPSSAAAKDGSFEVRGVPAGSYTLAATNMNGNMKTLARQSVEIASRDVDSIALSIQPLSTVQGSVKLERPAAASPAQTPPDLSTIHVNLAPADGPGFNLPGGSAKSDGTFSLIDVPAGAYKVNVYNLPDGSYLRSIRYDNQDVLASGLNLAQGAGAVLEVGISAAAAEVDGTIKTEPQQSGAGVMVTLVPDPLIPDRTDLNRSAIADQNGQFALKNVAPGKYRAYAWEDVETGAPFDPTFLKPLENLGAKIAVGENARPQISLPLITAAQIEQPKP